VTDKLDNRTDNEEGNGVLGAIGLKKLRVAIGRDDSGWHERFAAELEKIHIEGNQLEFDILNLEADNWLTIVTPFPVVVWKPSYMGPNIAAQFFAKVYILQNLYGKIVLPNVSTVLHFENKNAQKYIFEALAVPTPKTSVSFDYRDAVDLLEQQEFPLVFKQSHGAGSQNVELVTHRKAGKARLSRILCHQRWSDGIKRAGAMWKAILWNFTEKWLWWKIWSVLTGKERFASVYWQRFVPGNSADLRVTVIGDTYAVGFWRKNRINDFRASGSGHIDYETPIPMDVVRYCVHLNKILDFDSMAYDVLFEDGHPLITEMSYGYLDKAVWSAPGYYEFDEHGENRFVSGHYWPQELWIRWMIKRVRRKYSVERNAICATNPAQILGDLEITGEAE
jgi:hypothetical protein